MAFAVLFPGQGSQFAGMGADLFDARPDLLGERSDRVLGWSLRRMCLEADEETLTRTEHSQPALFALCFALWDELASVLPAVPSGAAGHSLGEYTALAAAGAISFDDGLGLVAERGRAMSEAADREPSGMAALLGTDLDRAEAIAAQRRGSGGKLFVANINAPGQVVVSGGEDDLNWLLEQAPELGLRKVVRLKVAGAFHSPFMAPAEARLETALSTVIFSTPAFPVWSNISASPLPAGDEHHHLARQVVSAVRFSETLVNMAGTGIGTFVHVGPGEVTAGMAKRSAPGANTLIVSDLTGIAPAAAALGSIERQESYD
ncbi:MAG: ACP S-malonyltransferase [Actinomycetota bacterium]